MYRPWRVPPALRRDVVHLAAYDERSPRPVRRREIPHGGVTLILGLEPTLTLDGLPGSPPAFVAGMTDAPTMTEFVGRQCGVQVDLSPLGALRLLGCPGEELARRVVDVDALGGVLAGRPRRLRADGTWEARRRRVDLALLQLREGGRREPDPEVVRAWDLLASSAGRVTVNALAAEVGWSRRHLLTRFRTQVGLAPTPTRRVLRLHRAASLLLPGRGPGRRPGPERITDVAAAAGYADHAHLVREFHDLAGCTPGALMAECSDVQAGTTADS